MKKFHVFILLAFSVLGIVFLHRALIGGELALPGDILIGHYYPWRDYVWDGRPSGYPTKNFDLSDAVVAFFPWRKFTVDQLSSGTIPFRNPYNFLGTPHLANISAAVFYPLSIIFYVMPYFAAWDVFIVLQIILAGFFMYLFLENLKFDRMISFYGGGVFALSAYMMTTLEYSVIGHTVLWGPLILYSIDKLISTRKIRYLLFGVAAGICLFLAGFIQVSMYVYALCIAYFIFRAKRKDYLFSPLFLFPPLISMFQLLPFFDVAMESSRIEGYFSNFSDARKYLVPFERLIGGLIPDYYGNPAKWNFIGEISYTEFAFYVGIATIIFAIYSLGNIKKNRNIAFWSVVTFVAFLLFTQNPLSKLVHALNIPFYSTFLPSRLLSIFTIGLVVLSSYGLSFFKDSLVKNIKTVFGVYKIMLFLAGVIAFYFFDALALWRLEPEKGAVSLRNTLFSVVIFIVIAFSIILAKSFHKAFAAKVFMFWLMFITVVTFSDLARQGWTYNSFIDEALVFPKTKTLEYLEALPIAPRVVMSHQELLPAETNMYYDFSLLGGYDTVHSAKTERLINTLNYGSVDIDRVSGRVVFVSSLTSSRYDILSPEYYYILKEAGEPTRNMEQVLSDGRATLYKNTGAFPRAFVAEEIEKVEKSEALSKTLELANLKLKKAVIADEVDISELSREGGVEVVLDQGNEIVIKLKTQKPVMVVLNQAFDKAWLATDKQTNQDIKLYEVNYHFIGFIARAGEYSVRLNYSPRSFHIGRDVAVVSLFIFAAYVFVLRRKEHSRERIIKK